MDTQLLTSEIPADVTGWWVSEKYDGVRAIWTGTKLLSRHGKDLKAPAEFTKHFPKRRLDGELWLGRGEFNELQSILQTKGDDWEQVMFMVFDLAEAGTVEERIQETYRICDCKWPIRAVHHWQIESHEQLREIEKEIVFMGGEGCVIRRPGSLYRPGRMGDVIKVKRLVADVERWQG